MMVADLIQQIRELLASPETNPSRLAREVGLSVNALRGATSEDWTPRADTLIKLESYLARRNAAAEVLAKSDEPFLSSGETDIFTGCEVAA